MTPYIGEKERKVAPLPGKVDCEQLSFRPLVSVAEFDIIYIMSITKHVQKYFWEIDPEKASPRSYPDYYIQRILEFGDEKAISWLKLVYGKQKIKSVVNKGGLSPKTQNYWKLVL